MLRSIKSRSQKFHAESLTNSIAKTLSQGACSRFYADGIEGLRVSRCLGMQLAKTLEILEGKVITGKVQAGV